MRTSMRPTRSLFSGVAPVALAVLLLISACASPGAGESVATVATPASVAADDTSPPPAEANLAPPTTVPTATATPTPTRPTATTVPIITATSLPTPVLVGLDNTLVLYTALTAIRPTDEAQTLWEPHYGFKTWPPLPFVDPAVFDPLYGPGDHTSDISMFFFDHRAQTSPDGRYVLVPGLHSYPEYGVEGTGTWLLDLAAGEARQLLPDGIIATWSPNSDAITYVDNGVLYTLSIAPGAAPRALLADERLWSLYAKWSPNGDTIATIIAIEPEETEPYDPRYFVELWLVPVEGAEPRLLTTLEVFGMEYVSGQVAWSPDGQYVLAMNEVYDLDGNRVSPAYGGAVDWLPAGNNLLLRGDNGVDVITIAGETVAHIDDNYSDTWAFSHDGRRLAFVRGPLLDGPLKVAVFDLESGASWDARNGSAGIIRWSADDDRLILGSYELENSHRPQIITVSAEPNGAGEQLLLDYAQLIEVVAHPPRP